jgi:hypothetical protein
MNTEEKDPKLWKIARARAGFKRHLFTYAVVNIFLWLMWGFTGVKSGSYVPWPVFVTFGWGIGLAFNWYGVYYGYKDKMAQSEYEKLQREKLG